MKTVLVVDDEFGVAEVLDALLTDEGFRVITAINGRQALARMMEERPDLVLMDYMMPVLDGVGVLRAMAERPECAGLPVVMMSSLPEAALRSEGVRYAAFLRKPFRIAAVLDIVERMLKGEAS